MAITLGGALGQPGIFIAKAPPPIESPRAAPALRMMMTDSDNSGQDLTSVAGTSSSARRWPRRAWQFGGRIDISPAEARVGRSCICLCGGRQGRTEAL